MDCSLATPETTKKRNSKGDPLGWDEIVGKLMLCGFTPEEISNMTLRNAHQVLGAANEQFKMMARVQGATFEDDDEIQEVNVVNASMLESIINSSFGR